MPRQAVVACLVCAQPMKKVSVAGGVEVDVCDAHGVWLDRGELEAILRQYERPANAPSALGQAGSLLASSAVSGAGFGIGSAVASSLIRRLLG